MPPNKLSNNILLNLLARRNILIGNFQPRLPANMVHLRSTIMFAIVIRTIRIRPHDEHDLVFSRMEVVPDDYLVAVTF